MANEVLRKTKIEYSFQSSAYVPTGNNDLSTGSPTVVDFDFEPSDTAGLLDLAAQNSDKLDLGTTWPPEFFLIACIEWFGAVVADGLVKFYWSPSANSNAAAGNPGSPDGANASTHAPSGMTVDESVAQMKFIGSHINNGNQATQICVVGSFSAQMQYGQLVAVNKTGQTICATDDIESSVLMYGYIDEIQ